jgi:hypothetical protein
MTDDDLPEVFGTVMPRRLFKYRPLDSSEHKEWVRQTLLDDIIYLSTPDQFNDPLDCSPIRKVTTRIFCNELQPMMKDFYPGLNRRQRRQKFRTLRSKPSNFFEPALPAIDADEKTSSIYSLSSDPGSILMWAHYSSGHRGVCLEFDAKYLIGPLIPEILAGPITYSNERPTLTVAEKYDPPREMIRKTFFVKSDRWSHESEWRLFHYRGGAGPRKIHPAALRSVILGYKIATEDAEYIRSVARQRSVTISVKQAHFREGSFQLEVV